MNNPTVLDRACLELAVRAAALAVRVRAPRLALYFFDRACARVARERSSPTPNERVQ